MKCNLCEQEIKNYDSKFHHLIIDENHEVNICPDCIKKFEKWRGSVYATLFPTTTLKKKFGKQTLNQKSNLLV